MPVGLEVYGLFFGGDEFFLKNAAYRESAGRTKLIGQFPANRWGFLICMVMCGNGLMIGMAITVLIFKMTRKATETGASRVLRVVPLANLATNLRSAGRHYLPPPNTACPRLALGFATSKCNKQYF